MGGPAGRGDDHLVAGVQQLAQDMPQDRLGAAVDDDLVQIVVEAVVAPELLLDRPLQLIGAIEGRVLRHSLVDRRMGGGANALVCLEIRLAGGEIDDVAPFLFELNGEREDMRDRRRLEAVEDLTEFGHGGGDSL